MLMVGLPFVLKGVVNWVFDNVTSYVLTSIPSISTALASQSLTIHGVTSYIFNETYCATSLSIVMAAVSTRLVLNFIPFVK